MLHAPLLFWAVIFLQGTPAPRTFEAAEIKINRSNRAMDGQVLRGGQFILRSATLRLLVTAAWRTQDYRVVGGPSWLDEDRYDVVAKAPEDTPIDEERIMLQALLAERFHLAVHMDEKQTPVYAMKVAASGAKLTSADPNSTEKQGCSGGRLNGIAHRSCHAMTLGGFAMAVRSFAPNYIDKPIVDETGVSGVFDFSLDWTPNQLLKANGGLTVFDALQKQLGLKLEPRSEKIRVVVVDHAERLPE
jgi:uncharacterized protein (TIGR03435 family)